MENRHSIDVDFEIKGEPAISLNTGEYRYVELGPGMYEYKVSGMLWDVFSPVEFEADQNYFFRAQLAYASDHIHRVNVQWAAVHLY